MSKRSDIIRYLAVLTLALALVACKKEKKGEGGEAGKATEEGATDGDKTAEADDGASPMVMGSSKALAYLPKDAEVVISFSLASARSSGLWEKYKDQIGAAIAEDIAEMKAACGLDPLATLQSMTLGVHSVEEAKSMAVVEGFKRSDFEKCAKAAAEKDGKSFEAKPEGNLVHYTVGDEEMWAAWVGDATLLIAPESNDKAWVAERASGKNGLDTNKELMALAAKANQKSTVWFAGQPSDESEIGQNMGAVGAKPTGFYGSLNVTGGLDIDIGVAFANPDEAVKAESSAQQFLAMAKGQMPMGAQYVEKVQMSVEGSDVRAKLALTGKDLEQLGGLLGGLMGGLGGGGM